MSIDTPIASAPGDTTADPTKSNIVGLSLAELTDLDAQAGPPGFAARQLYEWLYRKVAFDFDEVTSLSKDLRSWLKDYFTVYHPEIAEIQGGAADGSRKMLFRLP